MKVPVQETPLIDTLFKRCTIDLVGPINPLSKKRHPYILTLVDYATKYPEATPLKTLTQLLWLKRCLTCTVVLGYQGTQLISDYMKEFTRLLDTQQLLHPTML